LVGISCLVFYALSGSSARVIFLNAHSMYLVLGGTLCALATSTPWKGIAGLLTSVFELRRPSSNSEQVHQALLEVSHNRESAAGKSHPLIAYAQSLWEQGVDPQIFQQMLTQHLEGRVETSEQAVAAMRNLSKYPPSLGMIGTVIGLVTLFSNLTPENQKNVGPSLALAMTATFYGLLLANGLLMPLADRLYVRHLAQVQLDEQVYRILILIHRNEAEAMISEEVHSIAA
jgi:chemotaxis protein MotA